MPRIEFLGKELEVVSAENGARAGLRGMVKEETKHSFIISTAKGDRRVLKRGAVFRLLMGGKRIRIAGSLLDRKPEDRIRIR
ncbi:MAG: ribonuclease P protein subunit [Nanoarchaeota archaeon]